MPLIVTSVPTFQSKFADYHHPHLAKPSADSILDTEREYAIACARAEALRLQLIQKQRTREVQAAVAELHLYEAYAAADPWGQFTTDRSLRRVPPQAALDFDSGIYSGYPYRHAVRQPLDPRTQYGYAQALAIQEREEANARFLVALGRNKAQERAQAIAHAYRKQREEAERCIEAKRRVGAKAQQEAQLRALIGPLFGILLSDDESSVNQEKAKYPSVCSKQTPLAPQFRVDDMTRDTLRDQAGHQGHPASSLFFMPPSSAVPTPNPIDRKGKARETPAIPFPRFSTPSTPTKPAVTPEPTTATSGKASSLKDELLKRKAADTDPDVQRTIDNLLSGLYGLNVTNQGPSSPRSSQAPSAGTLNKGRAKEVRFATTPQGAASPPAQTTPTPRNVEPKLFNGSGLHRTPALNPIISQKLLEVFRSRRARKLSLEAIEEIEDQLRKVETSFVFPSQLDFPEIINDAEAPPSPTSSDSEFKLSYTSNNKAVHAYEHALNELLTKLDAVDSQGDDAIRGRRKEVIGEVEKALNEVLRKVEDSRERASLSDKQGEDKPVESRDETITVESQDAIAFEQAEVTPFASIDVSEETTVDTVAVSDTAIPIEEQVTTSAASEEIVDATVPETLVERISVGNEVETEVAVSGIVLSGGIVDTIMETPTENREAISGAAVVTSQSAQPTLQSTPTDVEQADVLEVKEGSVELAVDVPQSVEEAQKFTSGKDEENEASEVTAGVAAESISVPTAVVTSLAEPIPVPLVTITTDDKGTSAIQESLFTGPVEPLTTTTPPISAPSSPNPSESGSEGNNSFLLQQPSLLTDPERKKPNFSQQDDNNNDDEEIEVLSVGDLSDGFVDEKDGSDWSEVEA